MKNKKSLALFVLAVSCLSVSLSSCSNEHATKWKNAGEYTYQDYLTVSPSNWNELTYQDNNDTNIMSYIGSSFFTYDFKFDAQGKIVPGEFDIEYSAATKLEDVTTTYAGNEKYAVPAEVKSGYAYKITLRNDLKWDDGTQIKAEDFVYTMKQQLDPTFKNYRADSFYNGALVIHNAKDYVYQGDKGWFGADTAYSTYSDSLDSNLVFALGSTVAKDKVLYVKDDGTEVMGDGAKAKSYIRSWLESQLGTSEFTAAQAASVLVGNFMPDVDPAKIVALEGKTFTQIKADAELKATWDRLIGWWQTEPNEELHFFTAEYTFPAVDFNNVGIFATSDTDLVVVLDNPLYLFEEDGKTLSYKAAYNFSSLPLVKRDLYEANKHEPQAGTTLWTSTYNTSVESTASWGPYKLTEFQSGKSYVLERNENWYGYGMEEYEGQYQTSRIAVEIISEWSTAWLKFQSGSVDGIGIDVSIAQDYKNSSRALFTPSDFVSSLQLQSDAAALKNRENDGEDKEILAETDFRKALSLAIDRRAFATQCTTASMAGFGLFNSMHYYDVAHGGVYRNEDVAKQVLCDVYAVDSSKYPSLSEAEKDVTGYNLAEARSLLTSAYNKAKADGKISDTDKVTIVFGTGAINESVQRQFDFIKNSWVELAVGTPLEGRIELSIEDKGSTWANDFRAGSYDVCMGGWSGAAWDPGYFLLAYLSPDYMYSTGWETDKVTMTYQVKGVTEKVDGVDVTDPTFTMSLLEWYDCLNGATSAPYDWSTGAVPESVRLGLIAALEKEILSVYYTVPLVNSYSASLLSYKVEYITDEYNTFMSYGGIRYMTYNYDDAEWFNYVKKNKIDYTV